MSPARLPIPPHPHGHPAGFKPRAAAVSLDHAIHARKHEPASPSPNARIKKGPPFPAGLEVGGYGIRTGR
ncbi:hypothetical protein SPHINGOT1_10315 [Sphingomonas sp. T1]|nr:hypothetical protein SPHINGOT1_10315 [Sphingomonas sp. T1]